MPERATGDTVVLVPAAGRGLRMGGPRKQFRLLGEHPLLAQTLRLFERQPAIDHLVVAAPAEGADVLQEELQGAGISKLCGVVAGGATRQASVQAALQAAPASCDVVLIHDAVRPFVEPRGIAAVVEAVRAHGAAALAVPMADTVRRGAEDRFGETVPRQGLYRMQTPQGFRRDWFEDAHALAARDAYQATDDVELVQRLGHPVRILPGSGLNVKITTPGDWALAELIWPAWQARHLIGEP